MKNKIIMYPGVHFEPQSFGLVANNSNLDHRKLLIYTLYFDQIVIPNNVVCRVDYIKTKTTETLLKEGFIEEVFIPGGINKIYDSHLNYVTEMISRNDINVTADNISHVFKLRANEILKNSGEAVTLINAIPEPSPDVEIDDILEFRAKRGSQLADLMHKINEFENRVRRAESKHVEIKECINDIDKSCADIIRVYGESKIKFNLSNVQLNYSSKSIAEWAALFYGGALAFGLPNTAAVMTGVGGGILSGITINSCLSIRNIDSKNPFNYVGEMSVNLKH
ncbi:DUF6236 family protein [Raoultella ornithinolytica]|nr:hypothetical protein [Raoultella ornithinolytica]